MANEIKKDWIDRALTLVNPQAAYKRLAWKQGIRSYDGGSTGGNNAAWVAVNAPAEQTNSVQRDLLRARARDLERNSDIAESVIGPFERNVVGTGIKVQAKVLKKDGETEDEKLNKQMEEIFETWCEAENCDITGELDFEEMQEMIIRRMIVDGGVASILSNNPYPKADIPFILQLREVDEIDSTKFSYGGASQNRIINGVELNEYNKPVAYYFKTITPDGLTLGDSKRIPADRVLFLHKKKRISQVREVSRLASTAERIRDVNEYSEAISVKERILACLSVFIKKMLPNTGGVGRGNTLSKDGKTGYNEMTLAPGLITELQPGDDVASVNPAGQASNAKEFITSQQRLIGSGQGLSYEAVSRDMSQVNYSSARQGLLEDKKTYEMFQRYLIKHFCRRVYREVITNAVLAGKLNIPDFFSDKERYLRHSWIAPGTPWIDPLKEVKANEAALNSNQTTLAQICASSGTDWREVAKQRAKEIEFTKSLNINQEEGQGNGTKTEKK